MKKNILFFMLGILSVVFISANINYVPNKSTGEVNRVVGLYVFMDCNPVLPYETLGEIKGKWHDSGYEEIKKCDFFHENLLTLLRTQGLD